MSDQITYVPANVVQKNPALVGLLQEQGYTVVIDEPNGQNGRGQQVTPVPETKAEGWTNVAGYPCKSRFTAYTSSLNIVKHLNGRCKCASGQPDECPAASRYGYTQEQLGSDTEIQVPDHLKKPA